MPVPAGNLVVAGVEVHGHGGVVQTLQGGEGVFVGLGIWQYFVSRWCQ